MWRNWKWNKQKLTWILGSHANGVYNNHFNDYDGMNKKSNSVNESTSLEYHLRETEQLLEISILKKKLRETERAMEQIMTEMTTQKINSNTSSNGHAPTDQAKSSDQVRIRKRKKQNERQISQSTQ